METIFFKRIYLEITNVCNQSCPFCPGTKRKKQFISADDFHLILEKLQGHTKHLYFHVLGEPLLHPKLGLFLDMAHELGFLVNLVTNGTLISKVGVDLKNKAALRQISFSLHGLAHLGIELTEKYLHDILRFIDSNNSQDFYSSLRLWAGEIEENIVVLNHLNKYFALNLDLVKMIKENPDKGIKLKDKIFLNPAREFVWPNLTGEVQAGRAFCQGLRQQIAILVDGTVVPCCLDGEGIISLGNIFSESLAEICTKIRSQKIITGFSQGTAVEELCKRCGYRTRFS